MEQVKIEVEINGNQARVTGVTGLLDWFEYMVTHDTDTLISEYIRYSHLSDDHNRLLSYRGLGKTSDIEINKWYPIVEFDSAMSLIKEGVEEMRKYLKSSKKVIVI